MYETQNHTDRRHNEADYKGAPKSEDQVGPIDHNSSPLLS